MNKKNLKDILKMLSNAVIVTGSHFSGTDMVAKIIAYEKGISSLVLDKDVESYPKVMDLITQQETGETKPIKYKPIVIESVRWTHYLHNIDPFDCTLVFVTRDIQDVIAAQKKFGWNGEETEKTKYKFAFPQADLGQPISKIKRDIFFKYQMTMRYNTIFMDYDMFRVHKMFQEI